MPSNISKTLNLFPSPRSRATEACRNHETDVAKQSSHPVNNPGHTLSRQVHVFLALGRVAYRRVRSLKIEHGRKAIIGNGDASKS